MNIINKIVESKLFSSLVVALLVAVGGAALTYAINKTTFEERMNLSDERLDDLSARLAQSEEDREDARDLNVMLCTVLTTAWEKGRLSLTDLGPASSRCGGVPAPPPAVEITQPIRGKHEPGQLTSVAGRIVVRGRVDHTKLGADEIWVATIVPGSNRYYVQGLWRDRLGPVVIDGDQEWTSPEVIVGNPESAADAGRHFDIVAVRVDLGARDRFWNYLRDCARRGDYPGMAGLPSGAKVEDRIEVVRE